MIKKKAARGKYPFGAARSAAQNPVPMAPGRSPDSIAQPMSLASLNGYFKKLAAATTNEKAVLEELVTNITTLTNRNAEMDDTIKKLAGEKRQLQQHLNSFQKKLSQEGSSGAA